MHLNSSNVFTMPHFNGLVKAFKIAYPDKTHALAQSEVTVYYNEIKKINVEILVGNKVAE